MNQHQNGIVRADPESFDFMLSLVNIEYCQGVVLSRKSVLFNQNLFVLCYSSLYRLSVSCSPSSHPIQVQWMTLDYNSKTVLGKLLQNNVWSLTWSMVNLLALRRLSDEHDLRRSLTKKNIKLKQYFLSLFKHYTIFICKIFTLNHYCILCISVVWDYFYFSLFCGVLPFFDLLYKFYFVISRFILYKT